MTVDLDRLQAAREQQHDGWTPARFRLRCPNRHEWDTDGHFHHDTYTARPHSPACPREGCGQGWWMMRRLHGHRVVELRARIAV